MSERGDIADRAAREQALEPARSFIVQAPAGSGKTELLTQRLLALLARVDEPEEILAITFTNKATAEMRRRVSDALVRAQDPSSPTEVHRRRTWELARAALARDRARGWNLNQHPGRLRVRTFDALCLALTRQMPMLSGFGTAPSIAEHATPLYREAARETLAELESGQEWSSSVANLLRHLDNNLATVEELLMAMLARRDQWLRRLAGGREDPRFADGIEARAADQGRSVCRFARRQLEAALAHVNLDAITTLVAAIPNSAVPELLALSDYAARNLREAGSDSPICRLIGLDALPPVTVEAVPLWRALSELLLTREGEWRRRLDKNLGFPPEKKGSTDSPKQRLANLIEQFSALDGLRDKLAALMQLPPPVYDDRQWQVLEALVHLLPMAAAQLMLVFARRGQVDFTAVAHAAATALGRPEAPTDLALALDYRIRHILVDEFQDTSYTQYDLLERLTAGWTAGDGRTLFAVGDPMQSIYRFREAEVGLYLRARHEGVGSVVLSPLTLTSNFRSQSGIVDWVNHAFARVFPAAEDLASGAVPYAPSTAVHQPGAEPAVSVHPLFTAAPEDEAERVMELIAAARRENPAGRIAVLVRARTHLAAIVAALRRRRLRFLAIDIEPLGHRPAVQDLLAITRALESFADRVAWLSLLRAPWCGLSLDDLLLLAGNDGKTPVWQAMQNESLIGRLSPDGRGRLLALRAILTRAIDDRGRIARRRAVESVWLAIGGPAFVVDDSDLEDAEVYLDLLESLDRPGAPLDLAQLEERVEKLYALPDAAPEDAVQLLTVHKAKGLEFDTVIVPGLGRRPRNESLPLLRWAELPRAHDRFDLLLAPLRPVGNERDRIYDYLQSLERERRRHEDTRLLYVAATRAKRRLHLLGHTGVTLDDGVQAEPPAAGSLLATLWPVVADHFHSAAASSATTHVTAPPSAEISTDRTGWRRPSDWSTPVPPAGVTAPREQTTIGPAVEYDWAGETARHVGSVMHRWLLRISEEGLSNWDAKRVAGLSSAVMAMLRRHGVANAEITQATEDVLTGLRQTLEDSRGRWLLDTQAEARSEYALTGLLDGDLVRVVLDRTFVDDEGRRWIVDYKTGIHTGADLDAFLDRERLRYAAQLERYARLLSALDPRPIRLGLYFPRLKGWKEWGG